MKMEPYSALNPVTIRLHWLVGGMMIALLATGIYMENTEAFSLYPWHKSFGVLIILFALARIAWRVKRGWLTPVADYTIIEKRLATMVHYLLIISTLLMPLSGIIMSAASGHGVDLFGLELVARNPDPANPQAVIAVNERIAGMGHTLHGVGGKLLLASLILHLAGALKHHWVDRDATLMRMVGRNIEG